MRKLKVHMNSKHSSSIPYKHSCKICGKQIKTKLKEHIQRSHGMFPCSLCDHHEESLKKLKVHINSKHISAVPKSYKHSCNICSIEIKTKLDLKAHIKSQHTSQQEAITYFCNQCDEQFTSKKHYREHSHCNKCEYQGNKHDLRIHIKSKHENLKYKCNRCEFRYKTKQGLRKHIDSFHLGLRYACSQCDQQFTEDSTLRNHIKLK